MADAGERSCADGVMGDGPGIEHGVQADTSKHGKDDGCRAIFVEVCADGVLGDSSTDVRGDDLAKRSIAFDEQRLQRGFTGDGLRPQQQEGLADGSGFAEPAQVLLDEREELLQAAGLGFDGEDPLCVINDSSEKFFFGSELMGHDASAVARCEPDVGDRDRTRAALGDQLHSGIDDSSLRDGASFQLGSVR